MEYVCYRDGAGCCVVLLLHGEQLVADILKAGIFRAIEGFAGNTGESTSVLEIKGIALGEK